MAPDLSESDMNRTEDHVSVTATVEAACAPSTPASETAADGGSQASTLRFPENSAAEENPQLNPRTERPASTTQPVQVPLPYQAAKDKGKKKETKINVNALPSYAEIYNAVPADGIDVETFTSQFKDCLDETNVHLFIAILKKLTTFDDGWLKRVTVMPGKDRLDKIVENAKRPAAMVRRDVKDISCQFPSTSTYDEPLTVTLDETAELVRAHSRILPKYFYRVFYETSATASCFVEQGQWPQNREVPYFEFRDGNAFQSLKDFSPMRDLRKERVRRHTTWSKKRDPSSYISVFNSIGHAIRRAQFHYEGSGRIGKRLSVAKISTDGLIPATIHGTAWEVETVWEKTSGNQNMEPRKRKVNNPVHLPVWIRGAKTLPKVPNTIKEIWEAGCEMWLSITEFRRADVGLKFACCGGHDYEWLACGQIPKSAVISVFPFDGKKIREIRSHSPVTVPDSVGSWTFDWETSMWQPKENTGAHNLATATAGCEKRKDSDSSSSNLEKSPKRSRSDGDRGESAKLFETFQAFLDTVQGSSLEDLYSLRDQAADLKKDLQVRYSGYTE